MKTEKKRVIAAIDNTAAAAPVLSAGAILASLFEGRLDALHVREDGVRVAEEAARAAGVDLRFVEGSVVPSLVTAASAADVAAMVLGARGTPGGRRPVGHTAFEVITSVGKPLGVVPPDAPCPAGVRRVLVALDGTMATAAALDEVVRRARGAELHVVVLHVHDEASLPLFGDQPQHEAEAWEREFLARYCATVEATVEVRVGLPGPEVLRGATETEADLIALGWAQDLSPGHAAVVREVLERSKIPVLLLPSRASRAEGRDSVVDAAPSLL